MKAKEYAEKYKGLIKPDISAAENKELISSMFKEMLGEMEELIKKRKIQSTTAYESLKREFNQKGDAISRELGDVLKHGWFLTLWKMAIESKENKE